MAQQAALRKKPAARKAKEEKLYPFKWEGKDRKGTRIDGVLQGENAALVKTQLRKQGILVTKIKRESTLFGKRPKPIKPLDIAFFTRQLATMMESGVPIIQAFEIIAEGAENPSVGKLVTQIKTDVAAGNTLADSLRQHPSILTICSATWLSRVSSRADWNRCLIALRLTRKRPRRSRPRSRRP